jgi:hypothetical protein
VFSRKKLAQPQQAIFFLDHFHQSSTFCSTFTIVRRSTPRVNVEQKVEDLPSICAHRDEVTAVDFKHTLVEAVMAYTAGNTHVSSNLDHAVAVSNERKG